MHAMTDTSDIACGALCGRVMDAALTDVFVLSLNTGKR